MINLCDTIVALATPSGLGAIGVIRISGPDTISIVDSMFHGIALSDVPSHTVHFGTIRAEDNEIIDEVLISIFKGPKSYTKEDVIEVSTHGSPYIIRRVIRLLLSGGARLAEPGEFTQRAFLNGRFDLAQAEAVADLIASENAGMQQHAMKQMRGGVSGEISSLRTQLIHFASMIELELDFAEEQVSFADRNEFKRLLTKLYDRIDKLIDSFGYGNALKNGIQLVIAGKPNVGKSTLLNALLNEDRAIVTEIPGTTRDVIEEVITIKGMTFRLTDTAGLRETTDPVEAIGVSRSKERMKQAMLIVYLLDLTNETMESIATQAKELEEGGTPFLLVGNKSDRVPSVRDEQLLTISAKEGRHLDKLMAAVFDALDLDSMRAYPTILTNSRHHEELIKTRAALEKAEEGLANGLSGDLLAFELRTALKHLGNITGDIDVDRDILGTIFSTFCIGK